MDCLPGDADVRDLLSAGVVDERQSKVLQRHPYFLLELLHLFSLPRLRHYSQVLGEEQHPLTPVQERHPVDLRHAVIRKLAEVVLDGNTL